MFLLGVNFLRRDGGRRVARRVLACSPHRSRSCRRCCRSPAPGSEKPADAATAAQPPETWLLGAVGQRIQRRPVLAAVAATLLMLSSPLPCSACASPTATRATTRRDKPAPGLRPARPGIRPGLQRTAAARRGAPRPRDAQALTGLSSAVAHTPGVAAVAPPELNQARTSPPSPPTPPPRRRARRPSNLVNRLRDSVIPPSSGAPARGDIGGETAAQSTSRTSSRASSRCLSASWSRCRRCCC